ncbi:MAG: ABC transporter permease [Dehalococcoidia bacterium]|nr:ABC transporter permease [Dehalococcoidia bacterium]
MKAFTQVFMAHYRQFMRDRAALFFTFIFPIMFILIFGWVFRNPGTEIFKIGIVDQGSPHSAGFITQGLDSVVVKGEKSFKIKTGELANQLQLLRDGDLDAVIVIPESMDSSLNLNQPADLQLYYDPSTTVNQQILVPILHQVIDGINLSLPGNVRFISMEEQSIQSHDLRYIDYLLPGILGMQLMFTGIFGGLPIIQQRQAHIIKRLGGTPLRRSTLVFGELVFRMILVLLTAVLIILVGRLVFDVQMVGNWLVLCGMVILGTLVFTCLGYLVAAFVKTEEAANPLLNIITFPMMFLSGTFFEVNNMPSYIEPVVKMLPLTYLSDALRQIMVDGSPLYSMTTDIGVMLVWTVVSLAITIRFFRWD